MLQQDSGELNKLTTESSTVQQAPHSNIHIFHYLNATTRAKCFTNLSTKCAPSGTASRSTVLLSAKIGELEPISILYIDHIYNIQYVHQGCHALYTNKTVREATTKYSHKEERADALKPTKSCGPRDSLVAWPVGEILATFSLACILLGAPAGPARGIVWHLVLEHL